MGSSIRRRALPASAVLLFVALLAPAGPAAAAGTAAAAPPSADPGARIVDPRRTPQRETETSIADGFTLAAVGDCIVSRPLAPLLSRDPGFTGVVRILRDAGAALGNLETSVIDVRGFKGWPEGGDDWLLVAEPQVAQDLKTLGFDMLARANNHALDWGVEGMRETGRRLDAAGLVHAGAGESRAEARAPRYLETPAGRVALVSMASTYRESSRALPPHGGAPARPGVNALRLTRETIVTPDMRNSLRAVRDRLRAEEQQCEAPAPEDSSGPDTLDLFDQRFRAGERPGLRYAMETVDLEENLAAIRQGKMHSDLLIATIHAHETDLDCERPGDFLPVLARAAIDAGADVFVAHGVHHLMPIAIHRGRPIFYGLANFFWSDIQEPLGSDLHERNRDLIGRGFDVPSRVTDADLTALLNARGFNDERVFQSVIAVTGFASGRPAEIRLHPVDLGYGRRLTESGVPRLAAPDVARSILERLQRLSAPHGTTIAIEKGVGVIRPR